MSGHARYTARDLLEYSETCGDDIAHLGRLLDHSTQSNIPRYETTHRYREQARGISVCKALGRSGLNLQMIRVRLSKSARYTLQIRE